MSLTVQTALALALQCAPSVDSPLIAAIGMLEPDPEPLALHDNTADETVHAPFAKLTAPKCIGIRHPVDLSLMQVNSQKLSLPDLSHDDLVTNDRTIAPGASPRRQSCHALAEDGCARVRITHYSAPATGGGPRPTEGDRGRHRGVSGLLPETAIAALITQCAGPNPPVDMLTRIIMHESGGNPTASNVNRDGSIDYGLAQINSSNLVWLGETPASILNPCRNIAAEARILRAFSGYATGSPDRGFVLEPPGQSVSYVESLANTRYRGAGYHPSLAAASRQQRGSAKLITMSTK